MKAPNPFAPWDESTIIGRKEQFKSFDNFLERITAGDSRILLVRGTPGSGKSMLLRHFQNEAKKMKLFTPYIKASKNEKLDRITKELFQELEAEIMDRVDSGEISEGVALAFIRQSRSGTLRVMINNVWRTLGRSFPAILFFIDDFDSVRKSGDILRHISNITAEKRKVGFVLSTTKRYRSVPENVEEMELGPLEEREFRDYISKILKKEPKMGDECAKSIYGDSGGTPKLIKQVCWILYDRIKEGDKVITKAHYSANMRNIMSFLSRDWFGRLYSSASAQEKSILKILARANKPLSVKETARQVNRPMGPTATLLLRLEAKGHIVKVQRGKYKVFSGLYAKFIKERG